MDNKTPGERFQYTYSAKEQQELQKLREKYLPKEASKLEQLRRLDQSVTRKGTAVSLIFGILGALILGLGMSCIMVWDKTLFIPGITIGVIGMTVMALAYPMYHRITEKERKKVAPEILRLTDELMK